MQVEDHSSSASIVEPETKKECQASITSEHSYFRTSTKPEKNVKLLFECEHTYSRGSGSILCEQSQSDSEQKKTNQPATETTENDSNAANPQRFDDGKNEQNETKATSADLPHNEEQHYCNCRTYKLKILQLRTTVLMVQHIVVKQI